MKRLLCVIFLFFLLSISTSTAVKITHDDEFIHFRNGEKLITQGVAVNGYREGFFFDRPFFATSLKVNNWEERTETYYTEECEWNNKTGMECWQVEHKKTVYDGFAEFPLRQMEAQITYDTHGKIAVNYLNLGDDIKNVTYWFWFRNAQHPELREDSKTLRLDYGIFYNYKDMIEDGFELKYYNNNTQLFGNGQMVALGFTKDYTLSENEDIYLDPVVSTINRYTQEPYYITYHDASTGTSTNRSLTGDDLFDDSFGINDYIEIVISLDDDYIPFIVLRSHAEGVVCIR